MSCFFPITQKRPLLLSTLLLLQVFILPGSVHSTVYQCQDRNGTLFLTNDRDKIPSDCPQLSELVGDDAATSSQASTSSTQERSKVVRDQRSSSPPPPHSRGEDPGSKELNPRTATEQVEDKAHKRELIIWDSLVQRMASRYNAIQNSNESPNEKAEKLEKLEDRLRMIRESLATSPLSAKEAAEIESKLPPL